MHFINDNSNLKPKHFLSFLLVFGVVYSGYNSMISALAYFVIIAAIFFFVLRDTKPKMSFIITALLLNIILFFQNIMLDVSSFSLQSLRFHIVLTALCLTSMMRYSLFSKHSFIFVAACHALLTISISSFLTLFSIFFGGETAWLYIRQYVIFLEIGDIWTDNALYYRVQLLGNPIIYALFCYTLVFYNDLRSVYSPRIIRVLLLISVLGVVSCGNVNYLLASIFVFVFFIFNLKSKLLKNSAFIIMVGCLPFALSFIWKLVVAKFAHGAQSGAHRIDLLNTFISSVSEHSFYFLTGFGIDATLPGHINPVLYGSHYIEIQSLLILYKLGALLFFTLMFLYILSILRTHGKRRLTFVLFYIMGSLANPYLFDTNHIVVTLLCSCSFNTKTRKPLNV
jgi:hypothetical protein